jgi:hypothetical protein
LQNEDDEYSYQQPAEPVAVAPVPLAQAATAADDAGVCSEDHSEMHSAADSDVESELNSEAADASPTAAAAADYSASIPHISQQHSSLWSSPVGNYEVQREVSGGLGWQQRQQQQPGVPPLSPGLSLAELSTGAPIDLEGSEADSDLLEPNMSPGWQPAAAAGRQLDDSDAEEDAAAPAVAAAGTQLMGSLVPCDSHSSASSAISSSYCASDAEEEVERTAFVEYSNPAAAGAEPLQPPLVQQPQQWPMPAQQHQQQELPHELDGGASWLQSSEGGDDGGYLDDGRASFDSGDELPVMRMQGGE